MLLLGHMISCNDFDSSTISGTYKRTWRHQLGILEETVVITPGHKSRQFDVLLNARHLDSSGKYERRPATIRTFHGIYDPADQKMDLQADGLRFYFNPEKHTLQLGDNTYGKER